MPLYRVINGMHKGCEGRPHEKKADLYSLQLEGGGIGWFPKHHIKRLECEVFNCRTYSDSPSHEYCQQCVTNGKQSPEAEKRIQPQPDGESSPFAELLRLAKSYDSGTGKLVSIVEAIDKFKSGELPKNRVTIGAFCSETREILSGLTPEELMHTGGDLIGKIEAVLDVMEGICGVGVV